MCVCVCVSFWATPNLPGVLSVSLENQPKTGYQLQEKHGPCEKKHGTTHRAVVIVPKRNQNEARGKIKYKEKNKAPPNPEAIPPPPSQKKGTTSRKENPGGGHTKTTPARKVQVICSPKSCVDTAVVSTSEAPRLRGLRVLRGRGGVSEARKRGGGGVSW